MAMGLGAGGQMKQEIYQDERPFRIMTKSRPAVALSTSATQRCGKP